MRTCAQCGRQTSGTEQFCATCGTFLGWQEGPEAAPTGPVGPFPAGSPSGASREPSSTGTPIAPPDTRVGVALALSADVVPVVPGEAARVEATVRNQGAIVDRYAVRVDGAPGGWVQTDPPQVAVYPGQDAEVTLSFRPPREAGVLAGPAPFRVVAQSVQNGGVHAVRDGVVDVAPLTSLEVDVRPERHETDRTAAFEVVVANRGNHDVVVDLEVREPQYQLQTQLAPERVHVPAFGGAATTLLVAAPGDPPETPRPYPFTVQAVLAGATPGDEVRAGADGVVVHRFRPPRAYVATQLGWLLAGALVGVLLAAGLAVLQWVLGVPVFRLGVTLPIAGVIAGVTVASALGARAAVRLRRGRRAGRTAAYLLVGTPLWATLLVLAGRGAFDRGDLGTLLAVVLPFAVANPALGARWLALLGTGERGLPPPRVHRRPQVVGTPAALPPPGSTRPRSGPARAPGRAPASGPGGRRPQVLAGVAAGVLLLAAVGVVAGYRLAPVPGEVVGGVNVRLGPGAGFPLVSPPLPDGTRVTISCAINGFGRLSSPLGDGFVFLDAVDTSWTPRPCG